jgi:uncharacterized protein YaiI (UPF0178 family)
MKIYVDADAFPRVLKEALFRVVNRLKIEAVLVAGKYINVPRSENVSCICVPGGVDAADDRIAELAEKGDLVITADIPLADRVVSKKAYAINPRGELYTEQNIKERLATRDLMEQLRNNGEISGGPAAYSDKDRQNFINQLDRFLTRHCKK